MEALLVADSQHLRAHGYERGSIVRILNVRFDGFTDAGELVDKLADITGGDASRVAFRVIRDSSDQFEFATYMLPWEAVDFHHLDEGGAVTHLRYWFASDKEPDGAYRHDVSRMADKYRRSLLRKYLGMITTDTIFALVEQSCDEQGLGKQIMGLGGLGARDQWRGALAWRSYDLGWSDALGLRACLLDAFLRHEGESPITFAERANLSLDELARPGSPRNDGEGSGRLALIGMAWSLLRDICAEATAGSVREVAMGLLRRALKIECEAPVSTMPFWVGMPPLPGLEAEHAEIVGGVLAERLASPDLTWQEIRDFLRGPEANLKVFALPGVPSEAVLVERMLSTWGVADDDPHLHALTDDGANAFRWEDRAAARAKLIENLHERHPHHLMLALESNLGIWKGLDDDARAGIVDNIRERMSDAKYMRDLRMYRDDLPLEIRALFNVYEH